MEACHKLTIRPEKARNRCEAAMHAEENRLRPFIEPTKQFIVPLFQRFYVWEKPYWNTLWTDVLELIADEDEQRTHFLGSIVVIPAAKSSPSLPKFVVIDGQQRLATLLVLLAALRDRARQVGDDHLADEIEQTLLVNKFKRGDEHDKLLLSQDDRLAFQHILRVQAPRPDHRLCQCYAFFEKKLNAHDAPDLSALFGAVADRLSVVTIILAASDNPYLVFESLNFKGHQLTEADLIRNYLFMCVPAEQQERLYQQYWQPMQNALGERLTEFVRHDLMRSGAFVKQSEVYITLKNRVPPSAVLGALTDLATFAGYYARLHDPAQEPHPALAAALARLGRLDVTTLYPFLLNVYHDYARHSLSATAFVEALRVLENYLVRRFVCGAPTSELNKIFPLLYRQTQQQTSDFIAALRRALQARNYPSNAQFRARLPTVKLYGKGGLEKKAKFLLETLERSYPNREQVQPDSLTIEHVMPQTLTEEWRAHLGEDAQTTHDLYLHTLGNLTLTGYNSPLSNKPFAEKRAVFAKSHLELNRYFQAVEQWRASEILRRAEILTEQALQCWPYFGDAAAPISDGDTVTGTLPESVTVLGTTVAVKTWREVLSATLETLAGAEPAKFAQLPDRFPSYLATSPQGFRAPKPLDNGYYIETNLGAASIHRCCQRIVEALNLPPDAWAVKVKPPSGGPP